MYQEVNRCTDNLAKGGCSHPGDFVVLDVPATDELCVILNFDASSLYFLRLLATTSPFMAS